MREVLAREPWWNFDPAQRPVPLDERGEDEGNLGPDSVDHAQQGGSGERAIVTVGELAAATASRSIPPGVAVGIPTAVRVFALLLVACVGMFALGWRQGRAAAVTASPNVTEATSFSDGDVSLNSSVGNARGRRDGGGG